MGDAAAQWQQEGWVLVEGLITTEEVKSAQTELAKVERVTEPVKKTVRKPDHHQRPADGPQFRLEQFSGITLFPIPESLSINSLFVHPALIQFASLALETDDLRVYQSRLWSKYGDGANYEQPLHRDQNHSLVPTRNDPGWWFMECFLYLSDVDETNGAPQLVPRSESVNETPQLSLIHI